jgi:hypothetical protein
MTTPRIRRSRWSFPLLVLSGLALIAAGAAIWFWRPPPKPIARTQLYVPLDIPNILNRPETHLSGESFLRNQAYIIKDRFVLNAALNNEQVAKLEVLRDRPDQLQWLETEIKVEFPGPEFIQISMSGEHPQDLLVLVNAVRKAYLEKAGDKELADREIQLKTLKDIRDDWEKRFKLNRRKMRDLQEKIGAVDPANLALVQKVALEELDGAKKDLVKVRSEIRQFRVEIGFHPEWLEAFWPQYVVTLSSVAALSPAPAPTLPLNFALIGLLRNEYLAMMPRPRIFVSQARLDSDPIAAELLKKIGKLKADIVTVKANSISEEAFRKDSASLRSAQDLALKELATRRQELRSQLEQDAFARAYQEELAKGATLRERYLMAKMLEKTLVEETQKLDEMTTNKNKQFVDLAELKDDIDKAEVILNKAGKKIDAIEIEQKAPPRVREFGEGSIYTPSEVERTLWTLAPVSLVCLGVVFLAFAGFRLRAIHRPDLPAADSQPTDA